MAHVDKIKKNKRRNYLINELMVFEGNEVEVLNLNGEVLFNPYHIAEILGIKNVKDSIRNMNDKQVIKLTNSKVGSTDFRKLHNTGENFLTESGVYKLVFKSRKPEAEKFTDWIADEVLPTIRKTGNYSISSEEFNERFNRLENFVKVSMKNLIDSSTINTYQQQQLNTAAKDKIGSLLGGAHSYNYKKQSRSYFANLWNDLKKKFKCGSYKDLSSVHFDNAEIFIKAWEGLSDC